MAVAKSALPLALTLPLRRRPSPAAAGEGKSLLPSPVATGEGLGGRAGPRQRLKRMAIHPDLPMSGQPSGSPPGGNAHGNASGNAGRDDSATAGAYADTSRTKAVSHEGGSHVDAERWR